jgi:hypothetical protein
MAGRENTVVTSQNSYAILNFIQFNDLRAVSLLAAARKWVAITAQPATRGLPMSHTEPHLPDDHRHEVIPDQNDAEPTKASAHAFCAVNLTGLNRPRPAGLPGTGRGVSP